MGFGISRFTTQMHTSSCKRLPHEPVVQPNLAMTPAQVAEMAAAGKPVSSTSVGTYYDGTPNPSFDLPIDQKRGCDIADAWNASVEAQDKLNDMKRRIHRASRKGGE